MQLARKYEGSIYVTKQKIHYVFLQAVCKGGMQLNAMFPSGIDTTCIVSPCVGQSYKHRGYYNTDM